MVEVLVPSLVEDRDVINVDDNTTSKCGLNISLRSLINIVGALVRPTGTAIHSKRPDLVLKAVFQVSLVFIQT
jgi:hypothetical protein